MKKELESWLRGETPQSAEKTDPVEGPAAAADKPVAAADLRLLVAALVTKSEEPQAEDTAGEVPDDALNETVEERVNVEEDVVSEAPAAADEAADLGLAEEKFVPVENFPQEQEGTEVENEAAVPDRAEELESEEQNDDKDPGADDGKSPAVESPEEARTRIETRLRQMKDMQRAAYMYEQGDDFLRNRRRRVVTLCALAAIVVCAAAALYFSFRSDPYDAMMSKARGLYEQERYADSFEAYSETSLEYRGRTEPFLGMGRAAGRMGRVDDSLTAYRSYMERLPADAERSRSSVFYEIGCLHAALKAWEDAQRSFEEAVAADASNYGAHFELGGVLEEQSQLDKALLAYKQALSLSPSSDAAMEAVQRVSFALDSQEETEEKEAAAEQEYRQLLSSGGTALKDAQYREASKYFADALAIRSADADAWVGFAEARSKLGDSAGAVKSLQRALERDPEHGQAKSKLAEIEAQNKKNTPPRRNRTSSSRQSPSARGTAKNGTAAAQAALSRKALFDAGVELYRSEEYAKAFESFAACLRSPEREQLPSESLAALTNPAAAGLTWKGPQVKLNIPAEARLLAEAVRLNPADRNLYVNLSMAASKIALNKQAMRSAMNETRSHALSRSNNL